jgi:hypothetical protein
MSYWDRVMDQEDFLLGYPNVTSNWRAVKGRAERFVVDAQISAGWMHSGYPVMAYQSVSGNQINLTHLLWEGEWGPYHEYGHNHQHADFIVPYSTEVTVNLFSAFVQESVNGIPVSGSDAYDMCADKIRDYLAAPDFESIVSADVWLHLNFFLVYKYAFGWSTIRSVLSSYALGDGTDYSDYSDYQKVDPLIIKLSRAAGKSLVGWADAWQYPITATARNALSTLPAWDYSTTLNAMESMMNPVQECYTPPTWRSTPVQYNDNLLDSVLTYHSDYRGTVSQTRSGYTCQRWDAQTPNSHSYGPEKYPCRGLQNNNYCRMNGEDKPWCYTTNGPRWEYCNSPICSSGDVLSLQPSAKPTLQPTSPSRAPTRQPSRAPTIQPSRAPTRQPSRAPTIQPSRAPTIQPSTAQPSRAPTIQPSRAPTRQPSRAPTIQPSTAQPSRAPTIQPSRAPTRQPSRAPTIQPSTAQPSRAPTIQPSRAPTRQPSRAPTRPPSRAPTRLPSRSPTLAPSRSPTRSPTIQPSRAPTRQPSRAPTRQPSRAPTLAF